MIFNHLTRAVLLVALVMLLQRGLHRRCWSFVANMVALIVCGFLMATWPLIFWTRDFYAATRDLYAGLKLLLALEIGYYVFRAFPRAFNVARVGSLLVLLLLAVGVAGGAPWFGWAKWSLSRASFNAATIWLFAGLGLLVLWYNLPLDRWHASIIGGYTAYFVLSSSLLASESAWAAYGKMLDPVLAAWWLYSAWSFGRVKVPVPIPVRA